MSKRIYKKKTQAINELEAEIQEKIREIATMKANQESYTELVEKNKDLNNAFVQKRSPISRNPSKNNINLETTNQDFSSQIESLQTQLDELQTSHEKLQGDFTEADAARAEKKSLDHSWSKKCLNYRKFKKNLIILRKKWSKLPTSRIISRLNSPNSENENNSLKEDNQTKTQRIEDLENELADQKAEYTKVREELNQIDNDSSETIKDLNMQIIGKDKIIEDLKEEIHDYEQIVPKWFIKMNLLK